MHDTTPDVLGCGCAACAVTTKAHADLVQSTHTAKATAPQHATGPTPYYEQALMSDHAWGKQVVTYTFGANEGHFSNREASSYTTMNDAQQVAIRGVLAEYAKVTNLTFREVNSSNPADADIVFRQADLPDNLAGWAFEPSDELGSDVVIDSRYNGTAVGRNAEYYGIEPGQFGFRLMMHETGHAMGLIHPFEGDVVLPDAEDSQNATVMSYNGSDSNAPAGGYVGGAVATRSGPFAPQTLMLYDIAAVQAIYGANHDYNPGNDTYSLNGDTTVYTLWDGAGIDTLDSSAYAGAATLDLREGLAYVSNVGDTSFWNAFGANIENANGGNAGDTITGNGLANQLLGNGGNDAINSGIGNDTVNGNMGNDTVAGGEGNDSLMGGKDVDIVYGGEGNDSLNGNNANDIVYGEAGDDVVRGGKDNDTMLGGSGDDTLYGDLGNDLMSGGDGSDMFMFCPGSGIDGITDFQDGIDLIQLVGYGFTSTNIAQAISGNDGNTVITLAGDASLTLSGVAASLIDAGDFIFS